MPQLEIKRPQTEVVVAFARLSGSQLSPAWFCIMSTPDIWITTQIGTRGKSQFSTLLVSITTITIF